MGIITGSGRPTLPPEETLDPPDWAELRRLGHVMVDDVLSYLETVRERPVWQPMPEEAKRRLRAPAPRAPEGATKAYQDFREAVLPYPTGNIHPRFWGWAMGTGTPFAALAEMLAAAMNPDVGDFDDAPRRVEAQVLAWCKEVMGFAPEASGLLVSGGSMANFVGLAVARNARAGFDVRQRGLAGGRHPLALYASREVHSSVKKAVEVLGLGREALRLVPVNPRYEMNVRVLEETIAEDRARGCRPFCIVASAGTVNTGATDDLEAVAALARREGLWLHVDGAFGAWAAISPALRGQVRGIEKADSLAFDLHKWGYLPIEAGCVLVRSQEEHRKAFSLTADYLAPGEGGISAVPDPQSGYGLQLSRGFRALKAWLSFKEHGFDRLSRLVEQNVAQARYLAERVREAKDLELLAPVPLNVVCFRYAPASLGERERNERNRRLLRRLQEGGLVLPSPTILEGRYGIRVAITNHRSRREDFDLLVSEALRLGREGA
jgi:aromatic-L-amino-acid decarboxylase